MRPIALSPQLQPGLDGGTIRVGVGMFTIGVRHLGLGQDEEITVGQAPLPMGQGRTVRVQRSGPFLAWMARELEPGATWPPSVAVP